MNLCQMGPSDNTWVTTIFPFPFKQTVNGTIANQSSYTQEIHLKVCTFMTRMEWYTTAMHKSTLSGFSTDIRSSTMGHLTKIILQRM